MTIKGAVITCAIVICYLMLCSWRFERLAENENKDNNALVINVNE